MECVILHDLFLNETSKYAHVFLPGSSSLEKDGTFTNAERRTGQSSPGRRAAGRLPGLGSDGEADERNGLRVSNTNMRARCSTSLHALRRPTAGASFDLIDRVGSAQWPVNEAAPEGTEVLHTEQFPRANGLGAFMLTAIRSDARAGQRPVSSAPDDRPYPEPVQCWYSDTPDGEFRMASRGRSGDVSRRHANTRSAHGR